jgi:putative transposase
MAEENRSWGYDRIVGALANLGHEVSDQTVGNVLRRHGVPPAPARKQTTTWAAFIRAHLAVLAGTDFFTVEVLTLRGLVTYYVLFFIHLESRKVDIAGITVHPNEQWIQQMARNATWRDAAPFETVAISCMIATRSTPSPSERSSSQVRSRRFPCLHEART